MGRYIDEAIILDRVALKLCPPGHHMRYLCQAWLAIHLSTRYSQLGTLRDLEEAIVLSREALARCPQGHPDRFKSLGNLANRLFTRYGQFGAVRDLDEAIVLSREALSLCSQGHPDRSKSLISLANNLSTRYNQLGTLRDLEEAIVLDREALLLRRQGHPNRSSSLHNLAADLSIRYNKFGASQDLEEAIVLDREALSLFPQGHPHRSKSLKNLATLLSTRHNQLGALRDLEEAIVLSREALSLLQKGHPDRPSSLNDLAIHLFTYYNQFGALRDLEESIVLFREALSLYPQGHPGRSSSLSNLAADLTIRYKQLGALRDLEEAIVLDREALSLHPQGHPGRSKSLINHALYLSTRYNQLGALQDLEEAIVLSREALLLCPQGHPDYSKSLNNLAVYLSTRFNQLYAFEDLEEAIVLSREALSLCPPGHPDRASSLLGLANHLSTCHDQLWALRDFDIVIDKEAPSLYQQGDPDHSPSLNSLVVWLSTRYNQLGIFRDLEEAIVLSREALSLCPHGHPDYSKSLGNLANHLFTRFNKLGTLQDLEEAIALSREAFSLYPHGHPDYSSSLSNLAIYLCTHYDWLVSRQTSSDLAAARNDLEELFSLYAQLAVVSHVVSLYDLSACRAWIHQAENFHHSSTLLAYETALRLLVEYLSLLPSLPQHLDLLRKQTSSLAVDAFSACLRNGTLEHAVELLEQGRGVFWNQLTRLHSPLDDVLASGPTGETLASEFKRLSLLIRRALGSLRADQHDRLYHHNLEMQKVVTSIRQLPGLSHFLRHLPFSDLQRAANAGPIIIVNASQHGCDALIIFADRGPVHIPLSITKKYVQHLSTTLRALTARATTMSAPNMLGRILRELWEDVVSPIVHFLQTTYPLQSRIWWCPTAEFSTLPLHAAGPYRKGQQNLAALYISSYTPTLSALIHARRPGSLKSPGNLKCFVGIGQANAAGQIELPSVSSELVNIGQYVNVAATFTQIEGDESSISRVSKELRSNRWVHLACHGLANSKKPFESAFALRDGEFTIERIIQCNLEDAEFAYLSACHTTVGDEESPDEMIHLASAMQFVGFRSVIGTMWAVDDAETNKITSSFYPLMLDENGRLDYTRAAYALNKTMRTVNLPLDQRVLYVHIGA